MFGWIFVGILAFIALVVGIARIAEELRNDRNIRMRKEVLRKIEDFGRVMPILCTNARDGVIAICKYRDFCYEVNRYWGRAYADLGTQKPWDRVVIAPENIFTFAEEQMLRPAHSGSAANLANLLTVEVGSFLTEEEERVLKSFTVEEQVEEILSRIAKRDRRLYVPFSDGSSADEYKKFYRDFYKAAEAIREALAERCNSSPRKTCGGPD